MLGPRRNLLLPFIGEVKPIAWGYRGQIKVFLLCQMKVEICISNKENPLSNSSNIAAMT